METAPGQGTDLDRAYAALEAIRVLSVDILAGIHSTQTMRVSERQGDPSATERRVAMARQLYAERRRRETLFPSIHHLFGEPAWDMLLDLFINEETGNMTRVSALCAMSATAETTALRYVIAMEQRGAIVSEAHPTDKRVRHLWLSAAAREAMCKMLDQICEAGVR